MFTEIARDEIPEVKPRGRRGYAVQTLKEFMASNMAAATVEIPGSTPKNVYQSLQTARRREKLPLDVVTRNGKVYLIRREG